MQVVEYRLAEHRQYNQIPKYPPWPRQVSEPQRRVAYSLDAYNVVEDLEEERDELVLRGDADCAEEVGARWVACVGLEFCARL